MGTHPLRLPLPWARLIRAAGVIVVCLAFRVGPAQAGYPQAEPCSLGSVGVDTSQANWFLQVHFGHTWGQVFKAEDTLIRAITVWKKANPDTVLDPMPLYVTEVDSLGRPDPQRILLQGPVLVVPVGKEEGKPIEVRYEFDPPLELPAPGKYWFGIKEGWCDAVFSILADTTNAYPDGWAWRMEPVYCEGIYHPESWPRFDLVFTVEFCQTTTSVDRSLGTWGKLKARYR